MQPFDRYFKTKMKNAAFHSLYAAQCHVCAHTMGIFEKVELENLCITTLAQDIGARPEALRALRDADHCDPRLVIRLCRRLGLPSPEACPEIKRRHGAIISQCP